MTDSPRDSPDPEVMFRNQNLECGQGDVDSGTEAEEQTDEPNSPRRSRSRSPFKQYSGHSPRVPHHRNQSPPYDSVNLYTRPDFSPPRRSVSPDRDIHNNRGRRFSGPSLKPDPFSGHENWEEYISHFENCADLSQWDHRQKVLMLAASLRGQARTFYMSLSQHEKNSYRSLVANLNQRFGSARHQNRWLAKLEMRRREPRESIAAVGDDIRQMAQKAYCNLDSVAQEALALNQLYKVISLEMKCRCIDKDCRTVSEAVDVIERYEAIMGDCSDRKKPNMRTIDSSPLVQSNCQAKSTLESTLERIEARLDRLENQAQYKQKYVPKQNNNPQRPAKRLCFTCSSPHHLFKNCPYNNQSHNYQADYAPHMTQPSQNQGNGNQSSL